MYVKYYYCEELNNLTYVEFAGNINKVSHRGQKCILFTIKILRIFLHLLSVQMKNFTFPTPSVPQYMTASQLQMQVHLSVLPKFTVRSKITVIYHIGLLSELQRHIRFIICLPQINGRCYEPHLAS